jgi:hypothetical protein
VALEQPRQVAVALLASTEGYTPTAQQLIERARARVGTIAEVADALAENLPQPKAPASRSRRRRRRKKQSTEAVTAALDGSAESADGGADAATQDAASAAAAERSAPAAHEGRAAEPPHAGNEPTPSEAAA